MGNFLGCHPSKQQQDETVVDPSSAPEQHPAAAAVKKVSSQSTTLTQQDSSNTTSHHQENDAVAPASATSNPPLHRNASSESLVFYDAFESLKDYEEAPDLGPLTVSTTTKDAAKAKATPTTPVDILPSDQHQWTPKFRAALDKMYKEFVTPNLATKAECMRFLTGKKGHATKASTQLRAYLEWRQLHQLDEQPVDDDEICEKDSLARDERLWRSACQRAIQFYRQQQEQQAAAAAAVAGQSVRRSSRRRSSVVVVYPENPDLPFFAKFLYAPDGTRLCARDGTLLMHALPARIDLSLASAETYALALGLFWEAQSNRYDAVQQYTVALDLRGGRGWANPKPNDLFPFLKATVAVMDQNFPERLAKTVLYPLPSAALFLWRVARMFLDATTRQKMVVVAGGSRSRDPPPNAGMTPVLDEAVLEQMEEERLAAFVVQ